MNEFMKKTDAWLDKTGEKLAKKEITIPTDIAGAVCFFFVGILLLLCIPGQVTVGKDEVVSGAAFPTYLCYIMLGGSVIVFIQNLLKIYRKEEIEKKTINALVEVKALIIFAILLIFWFLCNVTDLFVVGALFCAVSFLFFFRCKKKSYYAITIAFAVGIWAVFKFILNVNF